MGLFSFYLAFAGYRVLYHKRPDFGPAGDRARLRRDGNLFGCKFGAAGDVGCATGFRAEWRGPGAECFRADWNGRDGTRFAGISDEVRSDERSEEVDL